MAGFLLFFSPSPAWLAGWVGEACESDGLLDRLIGRKVYFTREEYGACEWGRMNQSNIFVSAVTSTSTDTRVPIRRLLWWKLLVSLLVGRQVTVSQRVAVARVAAPLDTWHGFSHGQPRFEIFFDAFLVCS